MGSKHTLRQTIEVALSVLVFVFLLAMVFNYLFQFPYLGFRYSSQDGMIVSLYGEDSNSRGLQIGDQIISINGVAITDLDQDWTLPFPHSLDGDFDLQIRRESSNLLANWQPSGISFEEFFARFVNLWWVGMAFFFFGSLSVLLVRPKDHKQTLLIVLCYLTAIWIVAGTVSRSRELFSPQIMRSAMWLSLPVYIHFHWIFPKALPVKKWAKAIGLALYGAAILGVVDAWFMVLPGIHYSVSLVIAFLVSALILVYRLLIREDERFEIRILALATMVAFMPILVISTLSNLSLAIFGGITTMLALPGAYFYVIYRNQLGDLELRINRLISAYLFVIAILVSLLLLVPAIPLAPFLDLEIISVVVAISILISLISIFLFEPFQRFIEERILKIPLPKKSLIEDMSRAISTSLTREKLVEQLEGRIFPSLLIRESLLLETTKKTGQVRTLVSYGLSQSQEKRWIQDLQNKATSPSFKHQILVLEEGETEVTWLFGKKDPEDYYPQTEKDVLSILAQQLAVALTNIEQAGQLRALHQSNIAREESEKKRLARDLHDQVLNRVAQLYMNLGELAETDAIQIEYQALTGEIRSAIYELRPPMLNFGLWAALNELFDETDRRSQGQTQLSMQIKKTDHRWAEQVEENIYRIVQQGLENALKHAKGQHIWLEGELSDKAVDLVLRDDGVGMSETPSRDLVSLLAERHYGIAGMFERAKLIDARIDVQSKAGQGTSVHLYWQAEQVKGE